MRVRHVNQLFHTIDPSPFHERDLDPGAEAFIDFMLSNRFQEDMPLNMFVSPVVESAKLPEVYAKWAVPVADPYSIDPADIGEHRDEWIEEWTNIVVR